MRSAIGLLVLYSVVEFIVLVNAVYIIVVLKPTEWPLVALVLGAVLGASSLLLLVYCLRGKASSYAGAFVLGIVGFLIEVLRFLLPRGPSAFIAISYSTIPALVAIASYLSLRDLRRRGPPVRQIPPG